MLKKKIFTLSALSAFAALPAMTLALGAATSASADPIPFGIDCMIHDANGAMLKDLGTVGTMMDGSYMASATFSYGDLSIQAVLQGTDPSTPEVNSPDQLKLSILKAATGALTASVTVDATPELNIALRAPNENIYLHCTKMGM